MKTLEEYIILAKEIHGNKYNYTELFKINNYPIKKYLVFAYDLAYKQKYLVYNIYGFQILFS